MTLRGVLRAIIGTGFRLHLARLAEAPRVDGDPAAGTLRLRGVVCTVCAARAGSALRSVPGVEQASVDVEGRATLRLSPGAQVDITSLQQALEGVVVGMSVRRLLERGVARLSGRTSWQQASR